MTSSLSIIVTGLIAQHPLGGVTWDYLQYVLGLARLGHDVYYFEDSGEWPYRLEVQQSNADYLVADCSANVAYLARVMARFGLEQRWAYRCPIDGQWFGLSGQVRNAVIRSADLLINISGTLHRPDEYRAVHRLAYIDSDPVFTQIKLAHRVPRFHKQVAAHDIHFSFGESLSSAILTTVQHWRPTRQPIVLSEWQHTIMPRDAFTTVMSWTSYKPLTYRGHTYGQKNVEFKRFIKLPNLVAPTVLELALRAVDRRMKPGALITRLTRQGWQIVSPAEVCPNLDSYRRYIQSSKAEWSVAKNGYVRGKSGWFSCRSACYLAAGRPVVVQDTGFSSVLPVGEGILSFNTLDEAAEGIQQVQGNYQRQSKAARDLAEAYFDSDKVLTRLIEESLNGAVATHARGETVERQPA